MRPRPLAPTRPRRALRLLWLTGLLGGALGLSCKSPPPSAQAPSCAECPPSRASLRGATPGGHPDERGERAEQRAAQKGAGAPALNGARTEPEVRPFRRCFSEDTALSAPRALSALLDRAADRYEQATRILGEQRPASRGSKAEPAATSPAPRATASDRPTGGSAGARSQDLSAHPLPPRVEDLLQDSLVCSEEAARVEPRSVEAHHGRAIALQELSRVEEARDAITRALALEPDDPETLAAAADLYVNRLPPALDHTETGLEFARRGSRRARRSHDKALIARLAQLEGQALNDLGHSREALARLEASLSAADDVQTRYERAVALFDLCRFEDARRGFAEVVSRVPDDAWAHHHQGLVLEFLGRTAEAELSFARARREAPKEFREPLPVSSEEFRQIVDRELRALPAEQRADLWAVRVETADLPDVTDLTAEEPPLSPTILGLFRGTPLPDSSGRQSAPPGAPAKPEAAERPAAAKVSATTPAAVNDDNQRTIVLYRRNLLRATSTKDELQAQVRTTLLHELGHLRGEDDDALRARGLE